MTTRFFRLLGLAAALPLALSACHSGTDVGDTNVERSSDKKAQASDPQGKTNGDSLAAGIPRDTSSRPSAQQQYNAAGQTSDKNHDGIAD